MMPREPRRCLVVDDDPNLRELVTFNLQAEGMQVYATDNADDAEILARSTQPHLVLLDIMMPGRDGYDLLASLKRHELTRHIPVVLLTAKATDEEVWQGWQSGADYYITKPFNMEELVYFFHMVFADEPEYTGP